MRYAIAAFAAVFGSAVLGGSVHAEDAPAAAPAPVTRPADGKLPHIQVDVKKRQVRVECEAVDAEMPLEFFCCAVNTQEHEAVLRSAAKASHIHLGLVMLGLEPGQPVHMSKATGKWQPPSGPPLHITCEYIKDGKAMSVPAYRMMRNAKTKKVMPPLTWVFTGSRVMEDGTYAADMTGYLVSIVNFDLTTIDIPEVVSSANETLEWEINPDVLPKKGAPVTMVIEPAGKEDKPADPPPAGVAPTIGEPALATAPPNNTPEPTTRISDVHIDDQRVKQLKAQWDKQVLPYRKELADAASTHYKVVAALRAEQQRLIDEADRIQRVIDEVEKEYQDMTAPRQ